MSNPRVIIDTDPGLDDAVAILFALGSGRFDVLGLTTVAGNIGLDRTTANALGLLAVVGRGDIPVLTGAERPLRRWGIDVVAIHGSDGLGGITLPPPLVTPQVGAVEWMARQLRDNPAGTIDILALGPLTNIARLVADHPDAAKRLGRLIIMGGTVDEPGNAGARSEFNFASDPEATAIVLQAGLTPTIVPLDVTRRVRADVDYVNALRGTVHGDVTAQVLEAYLQDGKQSRPLHDPCVMLIALAPELFGVETRMLSVDLSDGADAGALLPDANGSPVACALRVDVPGALALLKTGFTN